MAESLDEVLSDLEDHQTGEVDEHIDCAGCSETKEDVVANLEAALEASLQATKDIRALLRRAKKAKEE